MTSETNPPREIAIDVHGHFGRYARPNLPELTQAFSSADAQDVAGRAAAEAIAWTVVSPLRSLMPRGQADAAAGNREAAEAIPRTPGLLQWVVVNPRQPETFDQARTMLSAPTCVGIKIHPEEHEYAIAEFGDELFELAESLNAVVLTHSGESRSLPADFIPFADRHPGMKLILAHIGCSEDGDRTKQVRAIQASRRGNVYADTSSVQSVTPGLIEWAVSEVGADRVLFGTDSPLYNTAMQRRRIDSADLDDRAKRLILRGNAERLLPLPTSAEAAFTIGVTR